MSAPIFGPHNRRPEDRAGDQPVQDLGRAWAAACSVRALAVMAVRSLDCGMTDARWALQAMLARMARGCWWLLRFAQAGDFFESWMKRKAGVKDSGPR
jgi:CDP-diglyceride synthetase